jgi:hypothetical protein
MDSAGCARAAAALDGGDRRALQGGRGNGGALHARVRGDGLT